MLIIEHYAGRLPFWQQCRLQFYQFLINFLNIRKKFYKELKKIGIRAVNDLRNEKIGFKIREHTLRKAAYQFIIGEKEQESNSISVRSLADGDLGLMSLDDFIGKFVQKDLDK